MINNFTWMSICSLQNYTIWFTFIMLAGLLCTPFWVSRVTVHLLLTCTWDHMATYVMNIALIASQSQHGMWNFPLHPPRARPSECRPNARLRHGAPLSSGFMMPTCYDLFNEDVLVKWTIWIFKNDGIILELICMCIIMVSLSQKFTFCLEGHGHR